MKSAEVLQSLEWSIKIWRGFLDANGSQNAKRKWHSSKWYVSCLLCMLKAIATLSRSPPILLLFLFQIPTFGINLKSKKQSMLHQSCEGHWDAEDSKNKFSSISFTSYKKSNSYIKRYLEKRTQNLTVNWCAIVVIRKPDHLLLHVGHQPWTIVNPQ